MSGITIKMTQSSMSILTVDGGNRVESQNHSFSEIGVLYPGERFDMIVDWTFDITENSSFFEINLDRE